MIPEWRPIPEWPYEVSNLGRVRHRKHKRELAIILDRDGYPIVGFARTGMHPKQFKTHKLVASLFLGPCPEGHTVNHKDSDKTNNVIENLEYLTNGDNTRHYHAHRRMWACKQGGGTK